MSLNLRREIIGCLRVDGSVERHLRILQNFSSTGWEASLSWLSLSGMGLAFWDRLQKLSAEHAVPPKVAAVLAANLAGHRSRVAAMMPEFDCLNRNFERAGIDHAVWKGFALIPEYCPDACLRPSYDYDYLISERSWDSAQDVLQAAGYNLKPEPHRQLHVTFDPPNRASRPLPSPRGVYAATLPRKVELHLIPWHEEIVRISLKFPVRPLDRKLRRTWQGMSFFALSNRDAFIFQAVHAFQHILDGWCRLRWLLDIAYFLENQSTDSSFWKELNSFLQPGETLTEVVAVVITLAARLFHATLSATIKAQILSAMRGQVSLWVEHYGLRSALDNFCEDKYALFLYREFVQDESVWRGIRKHRLLPLHRPNRIAGSAATEPSALLPESWRQAWYVVQRLIHHSVRGAGYAWESARWDRLRRLTIKRVRP